MKRIALTLWAVAFPCLALGSEQMGGGSAHHMAQSGAEMAGSQHHMMEHGPKKALQEGGQSAFVAIQEVVASLMADPRTDWANVDIEALRQHLIDMDNVTLRARVVREDIEGGARFTVTSGDADVMASIRAMMFAHVGTMDGVEGWSMVAENVKDGAIMTVTGSDDARIRGLGFIGLMTVGMHHQAHHMALASGQNPHSH